MTRRLFFIALSTVFTSLVTPTRLQEAHANNHFQTHLPAPATFQPLFTLPRTVSLQHLSYFVARDPAIAGTMNLGNGASDARVSEIKHLYSQLKSLQPSNAQFVATATTLMRLHEEQCYYLENLLTLGSSDPRYPAPESALKMEQTALLNIAAQLLPRFANHPSAGKWQAASILARIKFGDPSIDNEAKGFVKNNRNGDGARVALARIARDFANSPKNANSRTIDTALKFPMDGNSKAVFLLFRAEANRQFAGKQWLTWFQEAANSGRGLPGSEGDPGPIITRAAASVLQISLAHKLNEPDAAVLKFFQTFALNPFIHYYLEQTALTQVRKNPKQAAAIYREIETTTPIAVKPSSALPWRILDLYLLARDPQNTEGQWAQLIKNPNTFQSREVEIRVTALQNLYLIDAEKFPKPEPIKRFLRNHDLFSNKLATYAQNDKWPLKAIELLWKLQQFPEVASRSDTLAKSSKNPTTQVAAWRNAARARERILNIAMRPDFVIGKQLTAATETSEAYRQNLLNLAQHVKSPEADLSAFQASYILYLTGKEAEAKVQLEANIAQYSTTELASRAVSFLLALSQATKDHPYTEKIARLAESKRILPSQPSHRNLRGLIESVVWAQATSFSEKGKNEAAASKFLSFQKEFPQSKNGPTALDLAVKNQLATKALDAALNSMELLIKTYPRSPYFKETMWQAAEQARGARQYLRAANHYESFSKLFTDDAFTRRALIRAAECHKSTGRFANAVADYEWHLKKLTAKDERVRVMREIAELQAKYGKPTEAKAWLEKVAQNAAGDEAIWAWSLVLEMSLRQGDEAQTNTTINRILAIKPNGSDAFRGVAKAKYELGRRERKEILATKLQEEPRLATALENIMQRYEKTKSHLQAPCEIPRMEWCAPGYYESARLAESLTDLIDSIETPPSLNPVEAEKIHLNVITFAEKLRAERVELAQKAVEALSNGAPDQDAAERIRLYQENFSKGE